MAKITYGIKNVYAAKITRSESGVVSYGTPKALVGASEITLSTVGEPISVFADNVVYYKMGVNQGYEGNLNIYEIPNWFYTDFLGCTIDSNGVLVEDADGASGDFALIFEFNTDTAQTKRNILYNVTASRPEISSTTKEDTIDPQPFSIPITASPATDTEYVKATVVGDSTNTVWNAWLSSVYTPALATVYGVTVTVSHSTDPVEGAFVYCGGKSALTDAEGKAYFTLPNGTYDVYASDGTNTAAKDTVTVSGAAATKALSLT